MEYSAEVTRKSGEIERAAAQLTAANDRLRTLDRQKDDFLSQVSHELRTPMTSIRAFTEILTDTPDLDPGERQRFIGIINAESIRLTALLDEILDVAVVESGDAGRPLEPIDPAVALDQALDACLGLSHAGGVRVKRATDDATVRVMGNLARLSQVFINVLSNAIKYGASDDPVIRIATRVESGRYIVEIADNGPGIPGEEARTIFDKFARGWASETEQGAGLGLAISHAIVTRFGGTLRLLPGGEGARFEVALPIIA